MEFELTVRESIHDEDTGQLRLQAWVSRAPEEYDPNVFVYQKLPGVPESGITDRFVHIAGFADMYAFIPGSPDPELPYYRLSYYDLLFDSSEKLREAQELTEKFIQSLLRDISNKNSIPLADLVVVDLS